MESSSSVMPYPSPVERLDGPQVHPGRCYNHKTRGPKNDSHTPKKHRRSSLDGGGVLEICMNCGSLDHWAQQCPHPPHESHPGAAMHPPPPKRQKTHRASGQFRGDPQFHRHPQIPYDYPYPGSQADYDHIPMDRHYGPPGPNTQQRPPYERWHQGFPPREHYGYSRYGSQDAAPMSGYGPPFPSSHPPHGHDYYPRDYPSTSGETGYERFPADHYPYPPPEYHHQQPSKAWKRRSGPHGPMPPGPWVDEFGPHDPRDARVGNQIVWRPPVQVARPLPSTFDDRDEVSVLAPATSLRPGMSVSKYILDRPPEEFLCNIRDTEDWPFMMSDPIFLTISMDCEMVSKEELISRRNKIFETHRVQVKVEAEINEDHENLESEEENDDGRQSHDDSRDRDDRHSSPDSDVRSHTSLPTSSVKSEGPGSDPNVSLVKDDASPEPRTDNHHSGTIDDEEHRDSHSQPIPSEPPHMDRPGQKHLGVNGFPEKRRRPFDRRFKQSGTSGPSDDRHTKSHSSNGYTSKPQVRKGSGTTKDSPHKFNVGSHNQREDKKNSAQSTDSHLNRGVSVHDHKARKHQSQTEREARKYFQREDYPYSSDSEPRRQEDDVTPRFKRRQPQVAEAYSRRW
ncbi:hypothetical protein VTO42DRAFT_1232 [Malbranchea cinnamomea]